MRIALFVTCVNDLVFPGTGRAVVRILERLGHRVEFPVEQTCCGQMHANSGYREEALPMVRGFVDTFEGYDAVVAPSGSCVAMVRDSYPRLAAPDRDL
ncbi:MAG TPA: (Fe-S)-binding protein, partial [Asanoa sp.]